MKPRLNILDVSSAIGCNLSCKGCNHFSNYFAPGSKLDTDKLLYDIKTILPRVDINRVSVIGGEPLLNPRCEEIFTTCLEHASNDVYLYTNGELLESNDWIYKYLDHPKVYLRFSFHLPETTERGAKIIKTVRDFVAKTDHELFIGPAPNQTWKIRATEHHTNKDRWFYSIKKRGDKVYPYNHEKPDKSFKYCSCPNSQLYNGKLWKCPNTAFLREMLDVTGQRDDPEWQEYYVDGVSVDCADDELTKFCEGSILPDNVCRMCTAKPLHFSAAQQEKTQRKVINTYK
tara:strand:+ start:236 stop:1096 length:861 start_codon:yes stop_codon:yes gene_type:complete